MTTHNCPGCARAISSQKLTCRSCWSLIPRSLQAELYRTWNRGSPIDGYWEAREKCIDAVQPKTTEG